MKMSGKIFALITGSFFIGIFVTFGLQLLGDAISWAYEETPRRIVLFFVVGFVSWYIGYLLEFYIKHKHPSQQPKDILNFWRDM